MRFALILALAAAPLATRAQSFEPLPGPVGGWVLAVDVLPSGTALAATIGGVFRSTDGGLTWVPTWNGYAPDAIAPSSVLPVSANNLAHVPDGTAFAQTNAGLIRSTDDGQTWQGATQYAYGQGLAVDGMTVYASSGRTITRSNDSGETWTRGTANIPGDSPYDLVVLADGTVVASAGTAGFHRTVDGGDTWIPATSSFSTMNSEGRLVVLPSGRILALNGRVMLSQDGGDTWTSPFAFGSQPGLLALDDGRICTGSICSSDDGSTWSFTSPSTLFRYSDFARLSGGTILAARGTDVGLGGREGIARSEDGGLTFSVSNTGLAATKVDGVISLASGALVTGSDGGLQRSADGGQTWTRTDPGATECKAFSEEPGTGRLFAACLQRVFRSDDGGLTWANVTPSQGNIYAYTGVVADGGGVVTVSNYRTGAIRSTDGGATWAYMNAGFNTSSEEDLFGLHRAATGTLWAASQQGVFRWDDALARWVNAQPGYIYAIDTRGAEVYAAGYGNHFASTDGGLTWNETAVGAGYNLDVLAAENGSVYVTTLGGYDGSPDGRRPGVQRSDDSGATFTSLPVGPVYAGEGPSVLTTMPGGALLVGTRGTGLWASAAPVPVELARFDASLDGRAALLEWATASETANAGFGVEHRAPGSETFASLGFVEGAGTTSDGRDYRFQTAPLAAGLHRFRLRQVDLDGTAALSSEVEVAVGVAVGVDLVVAPNPSASGEARVWIGAARTGRLSVSVYDVLGREVGTLYDGDAEVGRALRLALPALPAGTYVVRARGAAGSAAVPVTVAR